MNDPAPSLHEPAWGTLDILAQLVRRDLAAARENGTSLYVALAEIQLRDTQRRRELFGSDAFGDPAWNILLELFIAGERSRPVALTACCVASGEAPSTGLRYLRELEAAGHVIRSPDPVDQRCIQLRLSSAAATAMRGHFAAFHARLVAITRSS